MYIIILEMFMEQLSVSDLPSAKWGRGGGSGLKMSKTWALPSLQLSRPEWGLGRMEAQNSSGSLPERRVRGGQVL